jgi:hypothetical protein
MPRFFGSRSRSGTPEASVARQPRRLGRYVAQVLVLVGLGGLAYYFAGPGGVSNPAAQSPRAVSYDQVAGYGDSCELFFAQTFRDDFASPPTGWVGADRGEPSREAGSLVIRPAAGESVALLYPSIEYQRGFVCAKIQSPIGLAAEAGDSAGIAFWAGDPANYYAVVLHRDGEYSVFRKANGTVATLVPKRAFAAVKTGNEALNTLQVLYSEPRYSVLINGQPAASYDLPSGEKRGMIGLIAGAALNKAGEWKFSGIVAGSDQPLRKSGP